MTIQYRLFHTSRLLCDATKDDAKVGANEPEDASKGPFTSIPGNFNQLSAAEKAAITERYKREQGTCARHILEFCQFQWM